MTYGGQLRRFGWVQEVSVLMERGQLVDLLVEAPEEINDDGKRWGPNSVLLINDEARSDNRRLEFRALMYNKILSLNFRRNIVAIKRRGLGRRDHNKVTFAALLMLGVLIEDSGHILGCVAIKGLFLSMPDMTSHKWMNRRVPLQHE